MEPIKIRIRWDDYKGEKTAEAWEAYVKETLIKHGVPILTFFKEKRVGTLYRFDDPTDFGVIEYVYVPWEPKYPRRKRKAKDGTVR